MFSASEIREKRFDKTVGFGYRVDDVDSYLISVAEYLNTLEEQNEVLNKKLEVLADKVQEYRQDEESLRSALIGAQKLGDSIIREARAKAEAILKEAEEKASQMLNEATEKSELMIKDATEKSDCMISNAQAQIVIEQNQLSKMQKEVATFKNRLLALYKQHIELISNLPGEVEISTEIERYSNEQQSSVDMKQEQKNEAPDNAEKTDEQTENEQVAAKISEKQAFTLEIKESEIDNLNKKEYNVINISSAFESDKPEKNTRESRFGPLKFGQGFDLKRDFDKKR